MYKIINRKKQFVTAVLDTVGKIIFSPVSLFRKKDPIKPETVKKICVIRTAYIGDVVMTLPMLAPLQQRYPDAAITFLTSTASASLLENNPYINDVLTFEPFWFYPTGIKNWLNFLMKLRTRSFDLVIETRGDIRELALIVFWMHARYRVSYDVGGGGYLLTHTVPYPGLTHKVDYHLNIVKYLGGVTQDARAEIFFSQAEEDRVEQLIDNNGISGEFIAIHPGSRLPLKLWGVGRYARLCDQVIQRTGKSVVLLGSRHEAALTTLLQELAQEELISLAGQLEIRELAGVLARAGLFICNDSAPMHISAAVNTPTVAIFGPSKAQETAPYTTRNRVVKSDFSCRYTCDESRCTAPEYHGCMEKVSVDDVLTAVVQITGW